MTLWEAANDAIARGERPFWLADNSRQNRVAARGDAPSPVGDKP